MSEKNFKVFKSSAGSGKTFALVKEYLKFCLREEDRYYFSRILAITFTNKASGEMKNRIISTLKKAKNKEAVLEEPLLKSCWEELGMEMDVFLRRSQNLLSALLHSYGDLSVSTIDKFMLKIIRSFSRDLKLPLNFDVDLQETKLLERVIAALLADIGLDPEADRTIFDYARWKIEEGKSWKLDKDLYDTAYSLYRESSDDYFEKVKDIGHQVYRELIKEYIKANETFKAKVVTEASKITQFMNDHQLEIDDFYYKSGGGFGKYMVLMAQGSLAPPNTRVKNAVEKETYHSNTAPEKVSIIKEHSSFLTEVGSNILSLFDSGWSAYIDRKMFIEQLPSQALLAKIDQGLTQLKKEENLINISDFNKLIGEIVMNDLIPFIYERIGERYRHIMVDEFQDTSIKQFQNLLPLIDESLSKGFENIIVGDAKQSIYRFRGAEVEQFSQMPNIELNEFQMGLNAERLESLKRNYKEMPLNTNWRSAAEVIKFNNRFFDHVFEHPLVHERNRLIFEGHEQAIPDNANLNGYVEVRLLEKEDKQLKEELHLKHVWEIIKELKAKDYEYSDIAILCDRKEHLSTIARFLNDKEIPILSSEALKLQHSASVIFIVDMLKWLSDPKNDEVSIRLFNYLFEKGKLRGDKREMEQIYLSSKGKGFHQLLKDQGLSIPLRPNSQENLLQWVEKQIRLFDLQHQYDPFLQFFEEYVLEFVQKQLGGIQEFLQAWENDLDKLSIELSNKGDAVQMMTIHKSKGLEFQMVILPFADYELDSQAKLVWVNGLPQPADDLGLDVGLLVTKKSMQEGQYSKSYDEEMIKRQGDLLNKIYVAFTRAESGLFILSQEPPKERNKIGLPVLLKDVVEDMRLEDSRCKSGHLHPKKEENEEEKPDNKPSVLQLQKYHSSSWNSKVSLSLEMRSHWQEDDQAMDSRAYGNLLHEILASIHVKEDAVKVLGDFLQKGKIDQLKREEIQAQLNDLFSKDQIAKFFEVEWKVSNERSFISSDYEILRPDRIVENDEELIILDYKSGEKRDRDIDQIKNYSIELSKISNKRVSAYLLYLSEQELVQVA